MYDITLCWRPNCQHAGNLHLNGKSCSICGCVCYLGALQIQLTGDVRSPYNYGHGKQIHSGQSEQSDQQKISQQNRGSAYAADEVSPRQVHLGVPG